jgi:hypothetical protein
MAKDSVELLLEGMAGPRPERRKTTPQSDGEASASYHAEHGVRRAGASEPPGPKVLVDRPVAGMVLREKRPSPGPSKHGGRDAISTFVPARVIRRRAAMALVAGMLIVLLSFMALRLTSRPVASGAAPVEATAAQTTPFATQSATPDEVPSREPSQVMAPTPQPPPSVAPAQVPEVAHSDARPTILGHPNAAPTSRHPHTAGDSPGVGGDLGEFKTKF